MERFSSVFAVNNKKTYAMAMLLGLGLGVISLVSPWLGLVSVLGGLFILLAFLRPVYLCYVVILATVLTSGMNRGRIIPYLIPNELALGLVAALAFPTILMIRHRNSSRSGLIVIGLIVLSIGTSIFPLLTYLARGISLPISEMFSLIAPLQYILIYSLFRFLPANEADIRNILRLMLACAAVIGLVGLLQAMRVGPVLNIIGTWYSSSHEEVALELGRVSSLLGAWNSLGTFLMLNLLVLRAVSVIRPALLAKKSLIIVTVLCAGGLLASGSYAGMIGLVLGLLVFEFFDNRGRMTMIILLISIPILAIPLRDSILTRFASQYGAGGFIPQTLSYRFMLWGDVFWPILQKTWLWGFHPILPTTIAWQSPESQYLGLLLRSGIFSLLAHLIWIGLVLTWLRRNVHKSTDLGRSLSIITFIMFIVLSIMGFTNPVFTFSGVIEYLWILLALIGVMEDMANDTSAR